MRRFAKIFAVAAERKGGVAALEDILAVTIHLNARNHLLWIHWVAAGANLRRYISIEKRHPGGTLELRN